MIKSLHVDGLNDHMTFKLDFFDDINIITGKNGAGKTTVLKLLWYAISGNLERIAPEIKFKSFSLKTDTTSISMKVVEKTPDKSWRRPEFELKYSAGDKTESFVFRPHNTEKLSEANRIISHRNNSSIFFPTFRRIEGGFSLSTGSDDERARTLHIREPIGSELFFSTDQFALQQAMDRLSDRLSVGGHKFVSSISTNDLIRLLTLKYAEISEKTNKKHMELSRSIIDEITASTSLSDSNANSSGTLENIKQRAREVTSESEELLRPFTVLSEMISDIFQYKGIKLADPVTLGEAKEAIASEDLSAGEKQMLSFLCYNAFAKQSSIFIDEPEISLHVDWQRALFPTLQKQSTTNQFIVATHSPFIYTKYGDRELLISDCRGDKSP